MRLEEWNSSNNEQERHYFKDDDQTYLFGYNPKILPEEWFDEIKDKISSLECL